MVDGPRVAFSTVYLRRGGPPIRAEAVIEAMENPHDRQVLAMCQREAVTALDIIDATDIPKSTVYRRINRLQELGLLRVEAGALKAGHVVDRYRATVEMASLVLQGGDVEARWRLLESPDERLYRLWTSLTGDEP